LQQPACRVALPEPQQLGVGWCTVNMAGRQVCWSGSHRRCILSGTHRDIGNGCWRCAGWIVPLNVTLYRHRKYTEVGFERRTFQDFYEQANGSHRGTMNPRQHSCGWSPADVDSNFVAWNTHVIAAEVRTAEDVSYSLGSRDTTSGVQSVTRGQCLTSHACLLTDVQCNVDVETVVAEHTTGSCERQESEVIRILQLQIELEKIRMHQSQVGMKAGNVNYPSRMTS
jgi:hypothetical protein